MGNEFVETARALVSAKSGEELIDAIAETLGAERERCALICRRRAELWRRTPLAASSIESARNEARARANEAAYLADVIAAGKDVVEGGEDQDKAN